MRDFYDQLKKLKNDLKASSDKEKTSKPDDKPQAKTIEVTVKKNRAASIPSSAPKPQSAPSLNSLSIHKQKKSATESPNAFLGRRKKNNTQRKRTAQNQAPKNQAGVTITRSVAPGAFTKAVQPSKPIAKPVASTPVAAVKFGQLILPTFTSLTRTSEFKQPDAWVARGANSQPSSSAGRLRSDIYIGLDFGTAFTKAAVQILDNIYPVDWSGVSETKEKYLLPTEYSEIENNLCFLGQHPNSPLEGLHANLKRSFITQRVSDVSLAKASVYIALVLQYIRGWIYKNHEAKLGSNSIGWHLNIGIPSDVLDQDKHAKQYKKLATIGWELSLLKQSEIKYETAFQLLTEDIPHRQDVRAITPVPELVAQLAGYSQSSRRQNGLHTLVDIGGGTVDMVTFNVHQAEGDDVFPFFVANVKPLGSFALLENRLLNLANQHSQVSLDLQELLNAKAFANFYGLTTDSVLDIDKKFFRFFQSEFETVLSITHRKRYPSSPNWRNGIRTFIAGGGAFIPGYTESVTASRRPSNCPLQILQLPPHPKLADFDQKSDSYGRISVACGLAVDDFSLGTIRPASEVEDAGQLISTVNGLPARERVDRDELYPK